MYSSSPPSTSPTSPSLRYSMSGFVCLFVCLFNPRRCPPGLRSFCCLPRSQGPPLVCPILSARRTGLPTTTMLCHSPALSCAPSSCIRSTALYLVLLFSFAANATAFPYTPLPHWQAQKRAEPAKCNWRSLSRCRTYIHPYTYSMYLPIEGGRVETKSPGIGTLKKKQITERETSERASCRMGPVKKEKKESEMQQRGPKEAQT